MGKKRIRLVGAEETTKKEKRPKTKAVKTSKAQGRITDMSSLAVEEAERIAEKEKALEKEAQEIAAETAKAEVKAQRKKTIKRGHRYRAARAKVDRTKDYPLKEAITLVKGTSISRFPGSVELHLTTEKEGLSGEISFPHSTGQSVKIAIADDKTIERIKKNKLDFDVLLAAPAMMAKLAPLAKILGPKGLMPNPKHGTISENPKELAKEMAGKVRFKTEKKAPLIHLKIGKVDQSEQELTENTQTALQSIGLGQIQKAVLTATMGPGIKVSLESI